MEKVKKLTVKLDVWKMKNAAAANIIVLTKIIQGGNVMLTRRKNALKCYRHEKPESIVNFYRDFDVWETIGERYLGEGRGKDWFGVEWIRMDAMRSMTEVPGQKKIESFENWREKVKMPDIASAYNWEAEAEKAMKSWDRTNKASYCMFLHGPFERLMLLMGFENMMYAFYDNPDEIKEFFKEMTEHKIKYLDILDQYFDFDIITFHDDWGSNQNMFLPPEMWEEFIRPYIKTICDYTHELGMFFEIHSDGYMQPLVEHLVEIGVDAVDPLQSCNDVQYLKDNFGKEIVLSGGFDSTGVLERPGATEAEIRAEIRRCIDAYGKDGNYVTMYPIIDPLVEAIVSDEIERYGKNYYLK